jgi:hypothetical protein
MSLAPLPLAAIDNGRKRRAAAELANFMRAALVDSFLATTEPTDEDADSNLSFDYATSMLERCSRATRMCER